MIQGHTCRGLPALAGFSAMTTATEVHPRNEETGTIGSATDTEEFVDDYLRVNHGMTLEEATEDDAGFLGGLLGF